MSRPSSSLKVYSLTVAIQGLQVVLFVLYYYYAARLFFGADFDLLVYARRIAYVGQYVFMLGSNLGLVFFTQEEVVGTRADPLAKAVVITAAASLAAVGLALAFPGPLTVLMFGDSIQIGHSALAVVVATVGTAWTTLATFRMLSLGRVRAMNGLFVLSAAIPLVALVTGLPSGVAVLYATGIGLFAASLGALVVGGALPPLRRGALAGLGAFLRYGLGRMAYEVGVALLFLLAAFTAAHDFQDLREVSVLSLGLSVVSIVAVPFSTLGLLLMPGLRQGSLAGRPGREELGVVRPFLALLVVGSAAAMGGVAVAGQPLLTIWLGDALPAGAVRVFGLMTAASAFYALYAVFKNPIDALSDRPYNLVTVLLALAAYAVPYGALRLLAPARITTTSLALLNLLSFAVLGAGTAWVVWRTLGEKPVFPRLSSPAAVPVKRSGWDQ